METKNRTEVTNSVTLFFIQSQFLLNNENKDKPSEYRHTIRKCELCMLIAMKIIKIYNIFIIFIAVTSNKYKSTPSNSIGVNMSDIKQETNHETLVKLIIHITHAKINPMPAFPLYNSCMYRVSKQASITLWAKIVYHNDSQKLENLMNIP